jgi:N-methylhydantoinase B/oxoprolinase/acetone carboxylase alpha subunit
MIRLAYKAMISPDRAITGDSFPTLEVKIPDECIFNAKEPAACEWYFTGLGLLADLMITALGQAMPEKAGGWGAWQGSDGESAMINLSNGSFRNIPAEVYEVKHPMKVEEFSIRTDSGGPGRWRGGCGVVRTYRLYEDSNVSLWFERSKTPAWGIHGGKAGRPPENSIEGPQVRSSPLKLAHNRWHWSPRTGSGSYGKRTRPPGGARRRRRLGRRRAALVVIEEGRRVSCDGKAEGRAQARTHRMCVRARRHTTSTSRWTELARKRGSRSSRLSSQRKTQAHLVLPSGEPRRDTGQYQRQQPNPGTNTMTESMARGSSPSPPSSTRTRMST